MKQIQTKRNVDAFFGEKSDYYETYLNNTDQKRIASKYISVILGKLIKKNKIRIMCIGGGTGEGDLKVIKNLVDELGKVSIIIDYIDPSKKMYSEFEKNAKKLGLSRYIGDVYQKKFESPSCKPQKADVILALNSFYFIDNWKGNSKSNALVKLFGLLNTDGVAVIILRNEFSPHTKIKRLVGGGKTTGSLLKNSLRRNKIWHYSETVTSHIDLSQCFDSKLNFINSEQSNRLLSFILGDRWRYLPASQRSIVISALKKSIIKESKKRYLDAAHDYVWIRNTPDYATYEDPLRTNKTDKLEKKIKNVIKTYKDFPKEGIFFKDTTPLMRDPVLFKEIIEYVKDAYKDKHIDFCVAKDMQALIWAGAIAHALGCGVVPMFRKDLAGDVITAVYEHEYNPERVVNLQKVAIKKGQRVLLVDYIMATGETMRTMAKLVEHLGGVVAGIFTIIELKHLNPRRGLGKYDTHTIVKY